ncbi:Iron-containing redox enzyme [Pseudomonas marginalis]|nr:iron-containing redox enzyme family protein [Pseudomonas marginalis]SEB46002.1 Iron-containing redox enzyme [Pseudomonas marginalis]
MDVQIDVGIRGAAPQMPRYSVDALLSAELNPSLHEHADACLALIEQRFACAPAWLQLDLASFDAPLPEHIASALLERASAASHDPALYLPCTGTEDFIARQYAPQGLTHGSLLHSASSACRSHLPLSCLLHRMHSAQMGEARLDRNPNRLYRQFLEHLGIYLPAISSPRAARDPHLLPDAWTLTQLRLSLASQPEKYRAKLLGAALFETVYPLPHLVRSLSCTAYLQQMQWLQAQRLDTVIADAIAHVLSSPGTSLIHACRDIEAGFNLSMAIMQKWLEGLQHWVAQGRTGARQQMIRLVQDKARYAQGYHANMKMDGLAFDELMSSNPARFVDALGRSRWVVPGQPQRSRLINELISFKGPMFRIFNEADLVVIRNWINDLAEHAPTTVAAVEQVASATPAEPGQLISEPLSVPRRTGARTLYHQLINIERFPDARLQARAFAVRWLAQTRANAAPDDGAMPLPVYDAGQLRAWYDAKALGQVQAYTRQCEIEKSREQVIEEAVSLCPMIFIDGAWLQHWCAPGLLDSPTGSLFYQIYSDEIGNGDIRQNHANIYRQLMTAMGVELPDFEQRAFVDWDGFDDEDFDVPVFWLSLSLFPRHFLPETLGLNLAMEMSGVGGAYRQARDELRHYGFPTHFVDLHNTIDNVATGHSAMALQAIEGFMDECAHLPESAQALWQRIWVGYRALRAPQKNLKSWWARNTFYPSPTLSR